MNYSYVTKLQNFTQEMLHQSRLKLATIIIGRDLKVISNITITSDVIDYNKLYYKDSLLLNNKVKYVSDRQSFVFNPNNTTYVG